MPELFLKLNQLIADKELREQRIKHFYHQHYYRQKLIIAHGNMYSVIKEVLKIDENLNIGSVRSPLTPVTDADQLIVEEELA